MNSKNKKTPGAPPVFRPQPAAKTVQPKTANVAVNRRPPVAPLVYRPQPVPRVLQTKSALAQSSQKIVQPKAITPQRKSPKPPPVYRPEHKRVAQPKLSPLQRQTAMIGSRSVVQRAQHRYLNEEGLLPQQAEELDEFARRFNRAATGEPETRHTQAVTIDEDARIMLFTQRYLTPMADVVLPEPIELADDDYVIGDQKKVDENIHAEMLAISRYLTGDSKLPQFMGVSQPVCGRCSVVLTYFKIPHFSDGHITPNWVSPWRHANQYPPVALRGRIPEIVRKGNAHEYDYGDWR